MAAIALIAEFVTRTTALVAEFSTRTTALVAEALNYTAYVPGSGCDGTQLDFSCVENSGHAGGTA